MKTYLALRNVAAWVRPNRWADMRATERVEEAGQFAGLAAGGAYHVVALHNWSSNGACLEARGVGRIGERVKVTSATLNHAGRVVWIADGKVGIEFENL